MTRENRTGAFELPQVPTIADLIRVAIRKLQLDIRTHSVAKVESYDASKQTVNVEVQIKEVIKDLYNEKPNAVKALEPVKLQNIPVAWPRTSSAYLTFPLAEGDTGELHIQDRDLAQWLTLGKPVDPVSAFVQTLGGAVFHPNLFPSDAPITPATDLSAAVLECDLIKLGVNATLAAARVTDVTKAATTMDKWIQDVTLAIAAMAAAFNAPPAPMSSLGPGSVVPAIAPSDFGIIDSGSSKTTIE